MSLTKPRHTEPTPGQYAVACDVCGIEYYRSDLVRTPDGYLTCPDDIEGRDTVTLNKLNQQAAAAAVADSQRGRRGPW